MEHLIDQATHIDNGPIKLGLFARHKAVGAWERIKEIRDRIHKADVSNDPNSMYFEEGPVLLVIPPRAETGEDDEPLGRASSWIMDFRSSECARMHNHPLGERMLKILPDSPFQVWSATRIELTQELQDVKDVRELPVQIDEETGKPLYGIEIPAFTEFAVQIPRGTTHRFLGSGIAESVHPDELHEIGITGADPDMNNQTMPWTSLPPSERLCQVTPAELRNPYDEIEQRTAEAINRFSKRMAASGYTTERDIFEQLRSKGRRTSLFDIHQKLSDMGRNQSPDVARVEISELAGITANGSTVPVPKCLVLKHDAVDAFMNGFAQPSLAR